MSERNRNNLPQVKPFFEADPAFEKEGLVRYGMPGGKRAIVNAITSLKADGAKKADQNISGSPKESSDTINKIRALRAAVSLINEGNPNQINKEQLRDMITTIVLEGSQGISSVNSCIDPENQLLTSRREITQTIKMKRQAQLEQLEKTKETDIVPELDIKQ